MQPYFFPYIGYFQMMNAVDKFVIYDDVTYIKNGWINRNRILVNGMEYMYTIPLKNASSNTLIKEIQISLNTRTVTKLLKTLQQNYRKAPYFEEAFLLISSIFNQETKFIRDLCLKSLQLINMYLDMDTFIVETSTIYNNQNLKSQDRIIDICLQEKANHYVNLIGGQDLYDKKTFTNRGINLNFLESKEIKYSQFTNQFIPWLSMIDVMMFNSPQKIKQMLNDYTLV